MSRDEFMYLHDIADSCERILRYVENLSKDELIEDEKTYDAVIRNLEVIGEAAKNVSEDVRARLPGVKWRKVSGMRDMLIHVYFGIDNNILWDIVNKKIPELSHIINEFLSRE